jgi:tetratricopeptide (TPR) repeat protein
MNLCKTVSVILLSVAMNSCGNHTNQTPSAPADEEASPVTVTAADSLTHLELLIKTDSSSFEAWYDRGMLLAEMKDTPAAIISLERSFSLQPLQTSGIALANLYAETSNERAIALCDAILKKDTARTLTDAVFIKGIYYTKTGNDKLALLQFDECIKRDWKFTEAYIEKGIVLYNRKDLAQALKTFQLAATVTNTYADAYFWIGRCFEAQGQKKEAAENYTKALALDKDFIEAERALKRINIL